VSRNENDDQGRAGGGFGRLDEFGVIARLTAGLPTRADVVRGVGDDAALLDTGAAGLLVATCDAQVEGIHFLRHLATYEEIGHKALAVNLSDIAAMGAEPRWALVSLIVPDALDVADLDSLYAGIRELAGRYRVAVVGGNISRSPGPLCVDITLLGAVERSSALSRAGAEIGDRILVTGTLGSAAAGVVWLVSDPDPLLIASLSPQARERSRLAMVAPMPHVAEGQAIAASRLASAMADVSDGVAQDLWHICQASHVGAVLQADQLPVDSTTQEVARVYQRDPLDLALHGGEDYVLLLSAKPAAVPALQEAISGVGGMSYVIGQILDESQGMRLQLPDGVVAPLAPVGWDHFASTAIG
jgi:thiamine-monophosphate kinase